MSFWDRDPVMALDDLLAPIAISAFSVPNHGEGSPRISISRPIRSAEKKMDFSCVLGD
jgi:hypothetical protein